MDRYLSELFTISIMAFALGMDAFSVGLGLGMFKISLRQVLKIGLVVGAFHVLMPAVGIVLGEIFTIKFGRIATMVSGVLLIGLGLQMVASNLVSKRASNRIPSGIGLILFALGVSIDSFSVGLSFGMIGMKIAPILILFGIVAMLLTWVGLLLGRGIHKALGIYSKILGGFILTTIGIKIILLIH